MARNDALRFLGRRREQAAEVQAALAAARTTLEHARAHTEHSALLSRTGHASEAVAAAQSAVSHALEAGDPELATLARGRLAASLVYAGRLPEAAAVLDAIGALPASATPHLRAQAAEWRSELAGARGDLGERQEQSRLAARLFAEAGDVRRAARAECNLADAHNRVGDYASAEAALRTGLEGCQRVGNRVMEAYALANLGYSLAMRGRSAEALRILDEAAVRANTNGDARLAVFVRLYRTRALAHHTDPRTVARAAEAAAVQAAREDLRGVQSLALALASRAHLEAKDPGGALGLSARAIELLESLDGIEEDEAEVFLAHARALAASGHAAEAQAVAARGRARLMRVADGIGDRSWRERFLEDVAAHRALMAYV
jgi:eukaryotic-like serine/threonine-protein kinase